MKKIISKIMSSVFNQLVSWGESYRMPGYVNYYFKDLHEQHVFANSMPLVVNWDKELMESNVRSEAAESKGTSALPGSIAGDKVMMSK